MALQQSIIFLSRSGFGYYFGGQTGYWFEFPKTSVRDIDVINKAEFSDKITAFIKQNQIPKSAYMLVLSQHVYFEKDYTGIPIDQQEKAVAAFVDTVPFENVFKKTFPIENGFKVVAANKDMILCIKQVLLENGLVLEAITPALVLETPLTETQSGLAPESVMFLFQKMSVLKQHSFSLDDLNMGSKTILQMSPQGQTIQKQPVSTKIILLLSVFFVLLLILVGLIARNYF